MLMVYKFFAVGVGVACVGALTAAANAVVPYPNAINGLSRSPVPRTQPPPFPPPHRVPVTTYDRLNAQAHGWQRVKAKFPDAAGTELLMTDGTVMVQGNGDSNWYSLEPDSSGSYINGTWTKEASLAYSPLYFASAVLADGKLIVNGGEYTFGQITETNQGAIYDPRANTWTSVQPPKGWREIGDGQSAVLADGTYMLGNCCYSVQALLNELSLSFTQTGAGKADRNAEEGWTLLPSGDLLTVDVTDPPNSELYNPTAGSWSSAGPTPVQLTSGEIGPQVLLFNGTVFVEGSTGHTALYNSISGKWSAGPDFPSVSGQQLDVADGPATLLTSGDVLAPASPGLYNTPVYFYLFNGAQFKGIPGPPNAANDSTYNLRLLMLPTGQVLETDGSNDVEVYTSGENPNLSIAPTIISVPSSLTPGTTYQVFGKRFNGFSQTNFYGDDDQQASNYPLVAIVNSVTHHVFFARTHDHSFMGVASQATVSTYFDVPTNIESGPGKLVVIANGVHSSPVNVTIQ